MSTHEELGCWDAVETLERIRHRDVSAREVLDAAIARAEAAMHLGAIVTPTFERACDSLEGARGPLAGLPTFIKDLAQEKGVATGWGSRAAGSYVSRRSDPFVARFAATGVVSLGKSATPELGLTATTEPLGQPACRNPWDPARSSGGSSGGAGTLVAAGVVPLAHASDGGGSVRIPASCCGLVGLKVSRHRMDMEGADMLPVNLAVDGCVTRSVRDTVAFWEALESVRPPRRVREIGPVAREPRGSLRVGVYTASPLGSVVHPDNQAAASAAAHLCETLGHDVEEIDCPFDAQHNEDFLRYWGFVAWIQKSTGKLLMHRGFDASKLEPWTHGIAGYFTSQPWEVAKATRRLRAFEQTHRRVMARYDVLICPTTAEPPPELGYLATDQPFETSFTRLKEYVPFTPIQNTAGAPAISLPLGRSSSGLPLGVQFAASPGNDRMLLELASSIEAAQPWERAAPRERWAPGSEAAG